MERRTGGGRRFGASAMAIMAALSMAATAPTIVTPNVKADVPKSAAAYKALKQWAGGKGRGPKRRPGERPVKVPVRQGQGLRLPDLPAPSGDAMMTEDMVVAVCVTVVIVALIFGQRRD